MGNRFCCALLGLLYLIGSSVAMADVTGSILGTVRESSGAVILGVKIVATNQETNITQTRLSDVSGQYHLLAIDSWSGFNCYENFTNFALSRGLSRFDIHALPAVSRCR